MSELLKFLINVFSHSPKEESDSLRKEIAKLELSGVETAGRLGALEKAVGVLGTKSEKKRFSWTQFLISTLIAIIGVGVSAWVAYIQNREHHDLVARVLKATFVTTPMNNGYPELYVDIGLINRGNQAEIIRRIFVQTTCLSPFSILLLENPTSQTVYSAETSSALVVCTKILRMISAWFPRLIRPMST